MTAFALDFLATDAWTLFRSGLRFDVHLGTLADALRTFAPLLSRSENVTLTGAQTGIRLAGAQFRQVLEELGPN